MSRPAARLGDICTGHNGYPPRPSIQGSPNVFFNGIPAHRQGDAYSIHCKPKGGCHGAVLASGSSTIWTNGRQQGRQTDPVSCGSRVAVGSPDIFIGD